MKLNCRFPPNDFGELLGKAFVDGLFDEIEYPTQKKSFEWELESLLIPEVDAAKEAGRLLAGMP